MHKVTFAFACLACVCHARPLAFKQHAAAEQADARHPAKSLAEALLAFNPTAPMTSPKQSVLSRQGPGTQVATLNNNIRRRGMNPWMIPLEERTDFPTVLVTAGILSLVSGIVNVLTFLDLGIPTAHHTGSATHIGRLVGKGSIAFGGLNGGVASTLATLMVGYLAGAMTTGYMAPDGEAVFQGRPSPGLMMSAIVIAFAALLRYNTGSIVLSLALMGYSQGLQNAITTRCSSCPVRTTHMTGALTDFGAGIGAWIKAYKSGSTLPSLRKPILFGLSIFAFALGGVVGRVLWLSYGILGALIPAAMVGLLGAGVRLHFSLGGVYI